MKNKIFSIFFVFFLTSIFVTNIVSPTKELSYSERRKLTKFPILSVQTISSGKFMEEFDRYALDQFAFREQFRSLKAFFDLSILKKRDNNDIYVIDNHVFKMEYPLDKEKVMMMSEKMNKIYDLYLKDMKVFYSIIPDKNYFVEDERGFLKIDYKELEKMMNQNVQHMEYINIMDCLELNDFYKTDTHWKQENLGEVIWAMGKKMGFSKKFDDINYIEKTYDPFYGVYYGQSALSIEPDTLTYLLSDSIRDAIVSNVEKGKEATSSLGVYNEEKLGKMDSYDVFLSGATPLITINNPHMKGKKELILFRDSFASSLAPLLIEEYSKITMIDLRYMSSESLDKFVEFTDQDVLFLYNTLIINNSNILK